MRKRGVIGIDIGTESVKAVAIETVPGEAFPRVVGVGAALAQGVRKGAVIAPAETASAIKNALEALEKSAEIKSGDVYAGVGGAGVSFQKSKGLVAISRADGQITKEDMRRAVQASEANLSRLQNREVLYSNPLFFKIDNETETHDPAGLAGIKLEVEALFVTAPTQNIKTLIRAFETADVDIEEMVVGILGSDKAVLDKKSKEIGVMLMDMGAATTSIILFEEGMPYSLEIIPFGSENITRDIASGLRITPEEAEKLKVNYGAVGEEASGFKKDELVYGKHSKKKLSEIIEARLSDIFELAEKHLRKMERAGLLAAGAVIVGGGANLPGIESFARDRLKLYAKVSEPQNLGGFKDKVKNPAWTQAVGTALWALEEESGTSPLLRGQTGAVLKWLRAFLP